MNDYFGMEMHCWRLGWHGYGVLPEFALFSLLGSSCHGLRGVALRLRSLIGFCEVEVPLACLESSHPPADCFSLLYTYVLA
jgi:hypothetical protein